MGNYYDRLREGQADYQSGKDWHSNKKKKDCDWSKKKKDCCDFIVASGFRAINITPQTVPANTFVKVPFQLEEFDLANEYNPVNSTFIPKRNGVYSILAAISFNPNNLIDYRLRIEIRVNGNPAIAVDNDFFGAGLNFANVASVSTIIELQAGDRVEVFAQSSTAGVIRAGSTTDGVESHFEAARFPSPIN